MHPKEGLGSLINLLKIYFRISRLTLQNIFDPVSPRFCEFGEHMTDMDLRSRENSRVKSLFMSSPNFELAALHLS